MPQGLGFSGGCLPRGIPAASLKRQAPRAEHGEHRESSAGSTRGLVEARVRLHDSEVWVLDCGSTLGDSTEDDVWAALTSSLARAFAGLPVSCVSVDAGFHTAHVRRQCSRRRWWVPVVSRAGEGKPSPGRWVRRASRPPGRTIPARGGQAGSPPDGCTYRAKSLARRSPSSPFTLATSGRGRQAVADCGWSPSSWSDARLGGRRSPRESRACSRPSRSAPRPARPQRRRGPGRARRDWRAAGASSDVGRDYLRDVREAYRDVHAQVAQRLHYSRRRS